MQAGVTCYYPLKGVEKKIKIEQNKKYHSIAFYTVITFTIVAIIAVIIFNYKEVFRYINDILVAISPVIWGLCIAFILNPLVMTLEKRFKFLEKKKQRPKLKRGIAIALSFIIVLSLLTVLLINAIPELISSIQQIFTNLSSYLNTLQDLVNKYFYSNKTLKDDWNIDFKKVNDFIFSKLQSYKPMFDDLILKMRDGTIAFAVGIKDFLIGCIVAVYLLFSKELFLAQCKKAIIAIFPTNAHYTILYICSKANKTFNRFLASNILDSLIVAMVNFIAMKIFDMPYAVLISFIIGITNMIPFFGPFIGAIPSICLLLVETPKLAIIYAIIILVLQQLDGNILAPKLFGDSLGLPTFWVLFAIFLGGGLFGFMGMVFFIPLFAVLYTLIKEFVLIKLQKKGLPTSTEDYLKKFPTQLENLEEIIEEDVPI
ncbi:AI-2E family transporter [Clostridia bacterium]|nr:AI-2E family transporter [Clostridia bacterium]